MHKENPRDYTVLSYITNINLARFTILTVNPYCEPLAWLISEAKVWLAILSNLAIKILPWIAASINEVGYRAGPAFPSPASATLPGIQYSWVGWSNVSEVSCSRKYNHWCYLTFPN